MATTISYIGNSGTDWAQLISGGKINAVYDQYDSINEWVEGVSGDLVSDDRLEIGMVVETLEGNQSINGNYITAGPNNYLQVQPISAYARFAIDMEQATGIGLLIAENDYAKVLNCDVFNGRSISGSPVIGIGSIGSNNILLKNPRTYDLFPEDGDDGDVVAGILVRGPAGFDSSCFQCEIVNPIVYDLKGNESCFGVAVEGDEHKIIGASIYNIDRLTQVDTITGFCAGILTKGTDHTIKNCISYTGYPEKDSKDYVIQSTNNTASNNLASDGTAPGSSSIQDIEPNDEWVNRWTRDFHLKTTAQSLSAGVVVAGYDYDFRDTTRGSVWNVGAENFPTATISASIIDGNGDGDFTTIQSWVDACPTNLISAGMVWKGICTDVVQFSEDVTVSNIISADSSCHMELSVSAGQRHLGYIGQGASLSGTIEINSPFFVLEHLRFTIPDVRVDVTSGTEWMINCPGDNTSKFITINSVLIEDCVTSGDGGTLYGIRIIENGGCRVLNSVVSNLWKYNTEADDGSLAGIYVSASEAPIPNQILNSIVTNIGSNAIWIFGNGGIGIEDNKTIVKNCIGMVRQYTYNQSSIVSTSQFFGGVVSADGGTNVITRLSGDYFNVDNFRNSSKIMISGVEYTLSGSNAYQSPTQLQGNSSVPAVSGVYTFVSERNADEPYQCNSLQ